MANWEALVALVIVVVVVLAVVGLIYTQPWSKIKVLVANDFYDSVEVRVYIDGVLKADVGLSRGDYSIVGVWSVSEGSHVVSIDCGYWYFYEGWFFGEWAYVGPDGTHDVAYSYYVGPLFTKNVWISLR